MKMANVKVGTVVENKVNGRRYKVTSVAGEPLTGLAETINPETGEVLISDDQGYDKVQIEENNAICFKTVFVPENTEMPEGYSVTDDGILIKDDKPVTEQGQLVIKNIIAELPGYLVLAVQPKNRTEDLVDLFAYVPEKDEFKKLIRSSSIPEPVIVKKMEDAMILGYNQTHLEDVLDENGKATGEKKTVFDNASLILVKNKCAKSVMFKRPMELSLIPVHGCDTKYLIGSAWKVDQNGVVVEGKLIYECISIDADFIYSNSLYAQPYAPIVSAAQVNIGSGGLALKGKDYILYNDLRIDSPLIEKMDGCYLVDITYGDHEVTVTMADSGYHTSSIIRKDTRDRGYIVSLAN